MELVKPELFTEAVRKLGLRSPVGSQLTSAQWARVPVALRERAFFSSQIENVNFLRDMRGFLDDFLTQARETITLPNGKTVTKLKVGSRADFVKLAREAAQRYGVGPVDPEDKGTIKDIQSEQRLNLIFDVNVEGAQQYSSWLQGMDPDALNEFPAWEFIRVQDVKTPRVPHQLNEGRIELKTNLPFWLSMNSPDFGGFGVPWGPWGFNSGMGTEDIDRDRAEEMGLIKPGEELEPAVKDFNEHLEASVRNLSPDLKSFLKDAFGDQIEIAGDTARWVAIPESAPAPASALVSPPAQAPPTPTAPATVTPPTTQSAPIGRPQDPQHPQDQIEAIAAKLDHLATQHTPGLTPEAKDALKAKAFEAIRIPKAERGTLNLNMTTKTVVRTVAKKAAKELEQLIAKPLLETTEITVKATNRDYQFYRAADKSVNLNIDCPVDHAAHEMVHAIEEQHPQIARTAIQYLLERGADGIIINIGSNARAFSDRWVECGGDIYTGRLYTHASKPDPAHIFGTEILSMGIERLLANPLGFWMTDPDHMLFCLRAFRGAIV